MIAGCLEKDPAQRRQRVQNAVTELKLAAILLLPDPPPPQPGARRLFPVPAVTAGARVVTLPRAAIEVSVEGPRGIPSPAFRRRAWLVGAALLTLAATSLAAVLLLKPKPAPGLLEFAVNSPENTTYPEMPTVSPDGRYLTFSALGRDGARLLWLRPLDALHPSVIPGSEGASAPFWSPDSQAIGFFAGGYLKKVSISGGPPRNICAVEAAAGGGAWNPDGVILFAPGLYGGFSRVPAAGGSPRQVLELDPSKSERADLWPQFLPDGNHFVFYQQTGLAETSGVYLGSLDNPDQPGQPAYRRLFASQTNAVYSPAPAGSAPSGYLLYTNQRNLLAQPFDPGRLEIAAEPLVVAGGISAIRSLALAPISASTTGVLVYQGVGQPTRQMVWVDRAGKQLAVSGEPAIWGPPRISPDGSRAVAARTSSNGGTAHLWLLEPDGGARQMDDEPMHEGSPVWSPDGSRIAFFGSREIYDIFVRAAQPGSRPELLLKSDGKKFPSDWSRDGRYIAFSVEDLDTRLDVWTMSLAGRRAAPMVDSIHAEGFATFSPDGKWLAYQSDQSGRNEVYVQAFDGINNGTKPALDGLCRRRAAPLALRRRRVVLHHRRWPHHERGPRRNLRCRRRRRPPTSRGPYAVSHPACPRHLESLRRQPDGQRFLLNIPLEWTGTAPMTVITNWTEKLKQQK